MNSRSLPGLRIFGLFEDVIADLHVPQSLNWVHLSFELNVAVDWCGSPSPEIGRDDRVVSRR